MKLKLVLTLVLLSVFGGAYSQTWLNGGNGIQYYYDGIGKRHVRQILVSPQSPFGVTDSLDFKADLRKVNIFSKNISAANLSGVNTGDQNLAPYELLSNKVINLSSPNNNTYPTTLAVSNAIPVVIQSVNDIKFNLPHAYIVPLDVTGTYSAALPIGFGKRVVIIGSSTWAGYGASTPAAGLGARVAADLTARGYTVYNQAISGDNSAGNVARFFSDVKALKPDIVVLANSITNELLATGTGAAFTTFTQNTLLMAREAQRIGAKVVVYGPFAWDNYTADSFKMVRSVENFLEKEGLYVISAMNNTMDITNNGHWWPAMTTDGTHGNDLGITVQYEAIQPDWDLTILSGKSINTLESPSYSWKETTAGSLSFSLEKTIRAFTLHGFFRGLNSSPTTADAQTLLFASNGTDMVRVTNSSDFLNLLVKGVLTTIPTPLKANTFTSIGLTCTFNGTQQVYSLYVDGILAMSYTAPDLITNFNSISYMARPDNQYPYLNGSIAKPYFSRLTLFPDEMLNLANQSAVRKGMAFYSDLSEVPGYTVSNKSESLLQVRITQGSFVREGLLNDKNVYELVANKQTDLISSATKYPTVNAVNNGLALKQNTLTLTTTGSGAATLSGATLNIPTPATITGVTSVNSRTGAVILTSSDVALGNVNNTSDLSKPVSTATNTALGFKAARDGSDAYGTWGVSTTGNSATSTKLATARNINGVLFDGTSDITIADGTKQPILVSGTNIKTINGTSVLGPGNFGTFPTLAGNNTFTGSNIYNLGTDKQFTLSAGISDVTAVALSAFNTANTALVNMEYRAQKHLFSSGSVSVTAVPVNSTDVVRKTELDTKQGALTLTTTGGTGTPATLVGNTLNIPTPIAGTTSSGNYTPVLSSLSGTTGFTSANVWRYMRIGNIVYVQGVTSIAANSMSSGVRSFRVSLPIATTNANAAGSLISAYPSDPISRGNVSTLTDNTLAYVEYYEQATSSTGIRFFISFAYEVQ